jgi:AcrR family transcriptional regulator
MKAEPSPPTRRTEGVRNQGRAARVVEDVLRATAEQLTRVGFAALRVDDVATLSGVNKTTIYRRWPTRADLVAAALRQTKTPQPTYQGSLRETVLAWFRVTSAFATSPLGSGLIRVIQTERGNPELEPITAALRAEYRLVRLGWLTQAVARGELPEGANLEVVCDLLFACSLVKMVVQGEPVDEAYVEAVFDLVVAGVRASASPVSTSPAPRL